MPLSLLASTALSDSERMPPPPPRRASDSPELETVMATVSTAFHVSADHGQLPDLVLVSDDTVQFYVSAARLHTDNAFAGVLPATGPLIAGLPSAHVPDSAEVLNIVLHACYGLSPAAFSPSVATLVAAIDRFPAYGLDGKALLAPATPLHTLLVAQAPLAPMLVYVAAARHDAFALAAASSAYLLSYPLYTITDELAEEMGPVYLNRLFLLHRRRLDSLKGFLAQAPHPHVEMPTCGFAEQATLTKSWLYVTACIIMEAQPDTTASAIESTLYSLMPQLSCMSCKAALKTRIEKLAVDWSLVGRTI
ncbi:hypothetical protein BD626DRAFT_536245 [Schizophyllum amplum]|uniref:Uncharacterized protein n=1 Tax=Schizophyllum amplum TaxID=97359 RepID=A0A550CJX9_9AGAR|nr:hypothetical protein BD626DRAFT_536245 [Auriculariopsis ampla]